MLPYVRMTGGCLCNGGNDVIDGKGSSAEHQDILDGDTGNDYIWGGSHDKLVGSTGDDTLDASGGGGFNILYAQEDADVLIGGNNDNLYGGPGDDNLYAGSGNTLTGNHDWDTFWLVTGELPETPNIVTDFTPGEDIIGLKDIKVNGQPISFNDLVFTQVDNNVTIAIEESINATLVPFATIWDITVEDLAQEDNFQIEESPEIIAPRFITATSGDDYFDSATPSTKNFIGAQQVLFTGAGNDTVDVSQVGERNYINTGSDDDTVFAGTYNRIVLGMGDDILFAGSGQGGNNITLGTGEDQLWLTDNDSVIPPTANKVSDFNPSDDVIGFANTVLSLDNKGDLWDYQQIGNDVVISAFGQEIAQLFNTTITNANFVFA